MPESLQREYLADPTIPRAARREICELLSDSAPEHVTAIAVLLVTELVTNAVVHAGGAIDLCATLTDGRLRIEVRDSSTVLPHPREPGAGGRGLRIVEQLSDAWGVRREDDAGKVTWCEISTA